MQPLTSDDPAAIGGYRLEARLGSGGMGRVYLAFTPAGRPVALKVVRSDLGDDQDFRVRFEQEIQAARRVRGLYTAELIDADPAATPPWLVTAYVPGPSVEEVIDRDGPMPEAMVFRLIAGVAEALQAIHAAGVIHRDLKPSNVLLAQDGPRVIDFGIARALAAAPMTRTGASMGSPDYMSPEQILNRPVTPAIDVFALGSLAAFAAVGRLPFGRGHITEVAHRVVHEPPDLAGCPAGLVPLIEACLQKDPHARPVPGQIIEFCVARAAVLGDPGPPRPTAVPVAAGGAHPPAGWSARSATVALDQARLAGPGRPRRPRASRSSPCWRSSPARRSPPPRCSSPSRPPGTGRRRRRQRRRIRRSYCHRSRARRPAAGGAAVPGAPGHRIVGAAGLHLGGGQRRGREHRRRAGQATSAIPSGSRSTSGRRIPSPRSCSTGRPPTRSPSRSRSPTTAPPGPISTPPTTGTGGSQTLPVSGTGRYVRMYGTQRGTQWGYSLWEFQIFGR